MRLSFEERCQLFPSEVIHELLQQITSQAKTIYEQNLQLGVDPYRHMGKNGEILLKAEHARKKK